MNLNNIHHHKVSQTGEDEALKQLQELLFGEKLAQYGDLISKLQHELAALAARTEPAEIIAQMQPVLVEMMHRQLADCIIPMIYEVIHNRTAENWEAMGCAIAPALPVAISHQVENSPSEIACAIAPEIAAAIQAQIHLDPDAIATVLASQMGAAIKQQITLERDAMVDALYPVIGSTIAKYMVEVVRSINTQIENTLSLEGIQRKFVAKIQGVSEAELIFKQAIKFSVRAIFLIHKTSGLVIAEVQQSGDEILEADLVVAMLTVIRDFVNDCMTTSHISELNAIDYGDSQIIFEVAGYCYLAVVVQGEPQGWFLDKMRRTLRSIIQKYSKSIQDFDGDRATIPPQISTQLQQLTSASKSQPAPKKPPILLIFSLILSLILLPYGYIHYQTTLAHRMETQTIQAFTATPELTVYSLSATVKGDTLQLDGKLPNAHLCYQAAQIASRVAPNLNIVNHIIAVKLPPDPVLAGAEVQRVTSIFNQLAGVNITAQYRDRAVTVQGSLSNRQDAETITRAFAQIPGVDRVTNTIQGLASDIPQRIYFDTGSAQITSGDILNKISSLQSFIYHHPEKNVRIIGYSYPHSSLTETQILAYLRAKAVRDVLIKQGIEPKRLQITGRVIVRDDVNANQPAWLSRYVEFKVFPPMD